MKMKNKKGFTLIELLVAVLIVAILAFLGIQQYNTAVGVAKIRSKIPLLKNLILSMERYYYQNDKYCYDIDKLDINFPYKSKNITETKGTYITDWGSMELGKVSDTTLTNITVTFNSRIVHAIYYQGGFVTYSWGVKNKGNCFALIDNKLQNNICKQLGKYHKETPYGYNVYLLND